MSEAKLLLHPSDQPVFRLLLDIRSCVCELRINDVPVWSNTGGAASRATLSVNEWLFAGENEIALHVMAPPGFEAKPDSPAILPDAAAVQCTLLYKRNRAPWLSMQEIFPWSYVHRDDFKNAGIFDPHAGHVHPPHDHGHEASEEAPPAEVITPAAVPAAPAPALLHPGQTAPLPLVPARIDWLPGHTGVKGGFTITLPPVWPVCPWLRALDLTTMQGLDYTVSRLTRSACDSLQRRDWAGLRRLFADRRAALQTAYYLNEASCDEALGFPELLKAPETKVTAPDAQAVKGIVCGNGKLLRAVAGDPAAPAVSLICPSLGCQADIETYWLNNGQEWRLAR
jgi:hypothetical protein